MRPRISGPVRNADLVFIGEHQRVLIELNALDGVRALPGDGVGGEQLDVVDVLSAIEVLEDGEHLAALHGPPEWPAVPVGAPGYRVEVPVQRQQGGLLEVVGGGTSPGDQFL